jgi:excisionase family DNA binding protein
LEEPHLLKFSPGPLVFTIFCDIFFLSLSGIEFFEVKVFPKPGLWESGLRFKGKTVFRFPQAFLVEARPGAGFLGKFQFQGAKKGMAKNNQKVRIFSALEVANICGVVNQTAINWIRNGHLKAFTTPGGQYRVYAEDLSVFLDKRGMRNSFDALHVITGDSARKTALIIDRDWDMNNRLKTWLQKNFPGYEVFQALDGFEAGYRMALSKPEIVFLNTFWPGFDGFELAKKIKNDPGLGNPFVVAFVNEEPEKPGGKISIWADACFSRWQDLARLRETIEDLEKRSRLAVTA